MKLRIYAGMAAFILLLCMAVSGCAPLNPEGAVCRGLLYRQCNITNGAYAGLATGMTYQEAFNAVCRNIERGRFSSYVVVYSSEGRSVYSYEGRSVYSGGSFCEQDVTVLQEEYWSFEQPGFMRDARVSVRFEGGRIVELSVGYSGWDP